MRIGLLFIAISIFGMLISEIKAASIGYDTTRIFKAMAKARRGESVSIGVLGGSITQGSLASAENKRWANLMTDWWKTTFPQSTINLVNAGLGGTGSDIGTHRVQGDLLKYNPDFVVVEFAVNESSGDYTVKMLEGLISQLLVADSLPGVMILTLKQADGVTAQASHKQVAAHYDVPLVSFADLIDSAVTADGISLVSIYGDGILHPNDIGMDYIADFLKDELNKIYSVLPADSLISEADTVLPAPIITDTYAHTYKYTNTTLVPTTNTGWELKAGGWMGHNPGDEITFTVDGNAVSIQYTQYFMSSLGQAEVWVDNGSPKTLDAHFNENWGPATRFWLVAENLPDGEHILHVKITANNSSGSTGHDFQILNVLKAGHFGSAAPIAYAGENIKTLINNTIQLNGRATDPENDTIHSFAWSIISKPDTSAAGILDENNDTATIIPDVAGYYYIGLTVNDGTSNSVTAIRVIHAVAKNVIPVANAGNDSTVATKIDCYLSGLISSDQDGDPLVFFWRIISKPAGSTDILKFANTPNPLFKPKVEGEYVIGLVVNDSLDNSIEDQIVITAITGYSGIDKNVDQKAHLSCFPNPATNQLHLEFYLSTPGQVNISIYSLSGIKVFENQQEFFQEGYQSIDLSMQNIFNNKGLYFLVLKTLNESFTNKLIIE